MDQQTIGTKLTTDSRHLISSPPTVNTVSLDSLRILIKHALRFQELSVIEYALNAWRNDPILEHYRVLLIEVNSHEKTIAFLKAQQEHYKKLCEATDKKNPDSLQKQLRFYLTSEEEAQRTLVSETTYHTLQGDNPDAIKLKEKLDTEQKKRQQKIQTLSAEKENITKKLGDLANKLNKIKLAFFTAKIKEEFAGKPRSIHNDFSFISAFATADSTEEIALLSPSEETVLLFFRENIVNLFPLQPMQAGDEHKKLFEDFLRELWNVSDSNPDQQELSLQFLFATLLRAGFNPFNQQEKHGETYFPIDRWLDDSTLSPHSTTVTFAENASAILDALLQNAPHIGIVGAIAEPEMFRPHTTRESDTSSSHPGSLLHS